jgi:hypothetical protein
MVNGMAIHLQRVRSCFLINFKSPQLPEMIRWYFPFFIAFLFFSSCSEDHHIKVQKNGSATVSYNLHFSNEDTTNSGKADTTDIAATKDSLYHIYNEFYDDPLISNYECKINDDLEVAITYKIKNVDSLGKFFSAFQRNTIKCKQSKHSFTIDAGTGDANPEDDIGGYSNMFQFNLTIELPGKIKSVENSSGLPVSYNGNVFTMKSNLGMLNYSGKRNLVVIKY